MPTPYALHHKRDALRAALFDCTLSDAPPVYKPKPGADPAIIAATWADHGVCSNCHQRTISVGRCLDCGAVPPAIPANFPQPSLASEYGPILKTAARLLAATCTCPRCAEKRATSKA